MFVDTAAVSCKSVHKTKIYNIDHIAVLPTTSQEVFRLDISVDNFLQVERMKSHEKLVCQEKRCLERKVSAAVSEKVVEAGAK